MPSPSLWLSSPPSAPRFEHRTDVGEVLGIGTARPRLSWTVERADADWVQTGYEVEVRIGGVSETHVVDGPEQVLVPWPARPLESRDRAEVRVRVGCGERWSPWGATGVVEVGLLRREDWTASFVSPRGIGVVGDPAPVISQTVHIPGHIQQARLYATAHGVYEASINGRRVDSSVLNPGWTSYDNRLRYQTFDVTQLVQAGENAVEVLVGNGWFRGNLGFAGKRAIYGDRLALLAQLEVTTTDGSVHVLATDASWQARDSAVVEDDLYNGQRTDLRLLDAAVIHSGVDVVHGDLSRLVAPQGPPIRPTQVLPAVDLWSSASGGTIVDFGQNAVGWVRLRTRCLATGTTVTLRHAEVLADGELNTIPLRGARATDTWILRGPEEETLEPRLTLHGFRYAEVSGVPDLQASDVELVVVGSDLRPTGTFNSSSDLLNRFHDNVIWSARGNFVDVPTDCPQRDERLGWTGDIQIFAPTALFLFDGAGFLTSWLADLAAEQLHDGRVPHVVPDVIRAEIGSLPAAAWGDAATIVPWTIYERTGDVGVLETQYDSMRAWVDREAAAAGADRLWTGGFQYGDWLDPTAPDDDAAAAKADPEVVATAHLVRSADIAGRAAAILGRTEDAQRFAALAAEVRKAFAQAYVTPDGRVVSDAQTVYALAIEWDLLPDRGQREAAGARLAELVRKTGFHIATGFVGTPLVCDALTSTGHHELAYRLLLQTSCPSWLYPVTMDATTVWERWDSMRPDGTTNPAGMTSFNHYALGAVADWMHRIAAGLAPSAPGYREILVRPRVTSSLTAVSATHQSPYGEARVGWSRHDGELTVEVRVPVGMTACVELPGLTRVVVRHGDHSWTVADPTLQPQGAAVPETVRDVIDDAVAWQRVVDTTTPFGVDDATAAKRLGPFLDSPIEELAVLMTLDEWVPEAFNLRQRLTETTAALLREHSSTLTSSMVPT